MNRLSDAERAAILRCLTDGTSIRSTASITGTSKATVLKLLLEVGEFGSLYQHLILRNLPCRRVEADGIWAYVGAKQRDARREGDGDIWTLTALDLDTKLMISWFVGDRTEESTTILMRDLASRVSGRIQLTTAGHAMYLAAGRRAFNFRNVQYEQVAKALGEPAEAEEAEERRRDSPPVCTGAKNIRLVGNPNPALISTSIVERSNLQTRMTMRRFIRLTNGFSKRAENHARAVSLSFMAYNFCTPHRTLTEANGGINTTPAMAAGLTDRPWKIEDILARMDPTRPLQSK